MICATTFLSDSVATLMAFQMTLSQEMSLIGAAVVTLIGVWLCWASPRYRMSVEEHMKDGKMTSDEAFRKIQLNQWLGPAVTVVGVALLLYFITR
jgi:ABC-type nickel/cobalt efflux system permease component RcnA